jgi:hypothetical protein
LKNQYGHDFAGAANAMVPRRTDTLSLAGAKGSALPNSGLASIDVAVITRPCAVRGKPRTIFMVGFLS